MSAIPVVVKGDTNTQLTGIAALIRSMPVRVAPILMPLLCTVLTSMRALERVVFASAVPKPRKWVTPTPRAGGTVGTIKHELTPDKYEVSIEIDGDAFDDDEIGMYAGLVQQMIQSLILFPDELLTTFLIAQGTANKAFDNVNFYATTHKWPEAKQGNQSNLYTGTGVTGAQVTADFYGALAAMQAWKDNEARLAIPAEELNGGDALLVHHAPALNKVMNEVFGVARNGDAFEVSSGVKSTLSGRALTRSDGYMTGNSYYIHSIKGGEGAKPFFFVDREAPSAEILGKGTEHWTKNGTVLIAARRRFGLGYGRPERSQKVSN